MVGCKMHTHSSIYLLICQSQPYSLESSTLGGKRLKHSLYPFPSWSCTSQWGHLSPSYTLKGNSLYIIRFIDLYKTKQVFCGLCFIKFCWKRFCNFRLTTDPQIKGQNYQLWRRFCTWVILSFLNLSHHQIFWMLIPRWAKLLRVFNCLMYGLRYNEIPTCCILTGPLI